MVTRQHSLLHSALNSCILITAYTWQFVIVSLKLIKKQQTQRQLSEKTLVQKNKKEKKSTAMGQ